MSPGGISGILAHRLSERPDIGERLSARAITETRKLEDLVREILKEAGGE